MPRRRRFTDQDIAFMMEMRSSDVPWKYIARVFDELDSTLVQAVRSAKESGMVSLKEAPHGSLPEHPVRTGKQMQSLPPAPLIGGIRPERLGLVRI